MELYLYQGFEGAATIVAPGKGATDVPRDVILSWRPGKFAATHDVYLGTIFDDVNDATTASDVYEGRLGVNTLPIAGDLDLGAVADVIMAEFWSKRFGYHTSYAVIEATSISHITGQPVVGAEVFTSNDKEIWQEYPWSMKDQSDWALALGVNRFVYHTFAHKPLGDEYRPGMTT